MLSSPPPHNPACTLIPMPTHGPLIHGHPITPQIAAPAFSEPTTPPRLIHPASRPCPWQGSLLLLNSFYMPISIASTNQLRSQAHCPTSCVQRLPITRCKFICWPSLFKVSTHLFPFYHTLTTLQKSPYDTSFHPTSSPFLSPELLMVPQLLPVHPTCIPVPLNNHPSPCLATHPKRTSHGCTLSTHVFTNTVTPTVTLITAQPHSLLRATLQHLQKLSLMGQHAMKYGFIYLHVYTHFVCVVAIISYKKKSWIMGYHAVWVGHLSVGTNSRWAGSDFWDWSKLETATRRNWLPSVQSGFGQISKTGNQLQSQFS